MDDIDIFDNIIKSALSTITSKHYLSIIGIYVHDVLYDQYLEDFIISFNKNDKKIKPGLYPVATGVGLGNFKESERKEMLEDIGNSVHWYAIRKENGKLYSFNGYSEKSPIIELSDREGYGVDKKYSKAKIEKFKTKNDQVFMDPERSFGLSAQEDYSHGFCQSISLMSYLGDEGLLSKKVEDEVRFRENMYIVLKWLKKFVAQNDYMWDVSNLMKQKDFLKKESINIILKRKKTNKKVITLRDLFNYITLKENDKLLNEWFTQEESDDDSE